MENIFSDYQQPSELDLNISQNLNWNINEDMKTIWNHHEIFETKNLMNKSALSGDQYLSHNHQYDSNEQEQILPLSNQHDDLRYQFIALNQINQTPFASIEKYFLQTSVAQNLSSGGEDSDIQIITIPKNEGGLIPQNKSEDFQISNEKEKMPPKVELQHAIEKASFNGRKDIIFKGLLRKMRKYFKKEFIQLTSYNDKKRRKNNDFLIINLARYAKTLQSKYFNYGWLKDKNNLKDLTYFLGAMFYPKDLIKTEALMLMRKEIEKISISFRSFSIGKFDFFNQFEAFKVLITIYLENILNQDSLDQDQKQAIQIMACYYY